MENQQQSEYYSLSEADYFIKRWEIEAVSYIQRLLYWNKQEAQSLYHDACLVIINQLKSGRIESVGKGYLLQTCKHLGANNWRKLLRDRRKFDQYCKEERELFQHSAKEKYGIDIFSEETADSNHDRKALRAYSLLKENCRKLIALKYIDDKSHKEIADVSEHVNSADSAKTTLSRCMKYWKRTLNKLTE